MISLQSVHPYNGDAPSLNKDRSSHHFLRVHLWNILPSHLPLAFSKKQRFKKLALIQG